MVVHTESKGFLTGFMVHAIQLRVLVQKFKNSTVCLPQKLQPRDDHFPICAVFDTFHSHSRKHNAFRSFLLIKIRYLRSSGQGNFISLHASGVCPGFGELHKVQNNNFERARFGTLSHVPVLMQAIFGGPVVLEIHAELHVPLHNFLIDLLPCFFLRGNQIMQLLQSIPLFLICVTPRRTTNQLVDAFQHVLRLWSVIIRPMHDDVKLWIK
mmetsp:Transcript_19522/g.28081  ORF Transcript_19522/g.28081 Transcript_19522/m.28081 type:complete len:211 (-) Transcript_19522:23-655(-)